MANDKDDIYVDDVVVQLEGLVKGYSKGDDSLDSLDIATIGDAIKALRMFADLKAEVAECDTYFRFADVPVGRLATRAAMLVDNFFAMKKRAEAAEARAERSDDALTVARAAVEEAAGELLVDLPEPGSDLAMVLIANRLLKGDLEATQRALATARADCESAYGKKVSLSRLKGKSRQ